MRTVILLLFMAFYINTLTAQPGPLNPDSVPETVRTTFKHEFPSIQPRWELDNKNYKAIYADPKTNSKGIIIYDPEGKVIRRDMETNSPPKQNKR